jgi:dissimilatory sulfite reductase related protein
MQKELAGQKVDVDIEGYMTNPDQWTGEIAQDIAKELNTELTQTHWDVLNWLREQHYQGQEVNIRKVGKSGIVDIKQFYQLFPGGPLKNASKIAGLKKPTSCL